MWYLHCDRIRDTDRQYGIVFCFSLLLTPIRESMKGLRTLYGGIRIAYDADAGGAGEAAWKFSHV